jgi:hypothetical protein
MKTNFDRYLEEHLKDPAFAARFEPAGETWDVALDRAALRRTERNSQRQNESKDKMTRK